MAKSFFTGNDAELYTGSNAFTTKITATPGAYGLSATDASNYEGKNVIFAEAYVLALDPTTRTRANVAAKNLARKELKAMAGDLAKKIDGTASVTDAQKIDLGLNVRKTPSPVPAPDVRPGIDQVSVVSRTVTVRIHDSASSTKRGKPPGVLYAKIYSFVGETYPTDPGLWTYEGDTTKGTYAVTFPDTVAPGTQVWITAAWANRKAQTGPVAIPMSAFLQFGMAAAA